MVAAFGCAWKDAESVAGATGPGHRGDPVEFFLPARAVYDGLSQGCSLRSVPRSIGGIMLSFPPLCARGGRRRMVGSTYREKG